MIVAQPERKTAEEEWVAVAAVNGYRCTMCGTVPPHAERAMYFARGLCSWCANVMDREDRLGARSV